MEAASFSIVKDSVTNTSKSQNLSKVTVQTGLTQFPAAGNVLFSSGNIYYGNGSAWTALATSGGSNVFSSISLTNATNQIVFDPVAGFRQTLSVTVPSANRTVTLPDFGANDSLVGLAAMQNLSNKTLASATMTGTTTFPGSSSIDGSGNATFDSVKLFNGSTTDQTFFTSGQLSASQINSIGTTPITLVPAPGVGLLLVPRTLTLNYVHGSAAFGSDNDFSLNYGATIVAVIATIDLHINSASNQVSISQPSSTVQSTSANILNQAVVLSSANNTLGTGSVINYTLTYDLITGGFS